MSRNLTVQVRASPDGLGFVMGMSLGDTFQSPSPGLVISRKYRFELHMILWVVRGNVFG